MEVLTNPYREPGEVSHVDPIENQMRVACRMLMEWRKYKPAIAGGALWSWAVDEPARDVDIFAKSTFFSRRKAKKLASSFHEFLYEERHSGYGWATVSHKSRRYIVQAGTVAVDLVLTPFSGIDATSRFDYHHCRVGYSRSRVEMAGADYYVRGDMARTTRGSEYARGEGTIRSKLKALWGKQEAWDAMEKTLRVVDCIYSSEQELLTNGVTS